MNVQQLMLSTTVACAAAFAADAMGQTELFRDNLEDGTNWGVNSTSDDVAATFGFDYGISALSIPEAPNTRVGDAPTTGLKAEANIIDPAAAESFIAYPIGQNFTGKYKLRFDAWMNFDLDAFYNNGQAGTTEFIGGGIGYNGVDSGVGTVGGGAQVIATGDGGSGSDWRVFAADAFLGTAEMEAGSRNGFDPHYADFLPSQPSPPGQLQIDLNTPGGVAGSPGFQWITFEVITDDQIGQINIEKPNGERLRIATFNQANRPFQSDGNIGLYYADLFSSVAAVAPLQFGLFDNVEVSTVPEPATAMLFAAGLGGVLLFRRRR